MGSEMCIRDRHFGQAYIKSEKVRASLVANSENITESRGGYEKGWFAASFEKSVCGDCRAHFDCVYLVEWGSLVRIHAEDIPDALHSCIVVASRVVR